MKFRRYFDTVRMRSAIGAPVQRMMYAQFLRSDLNKLELYGMRFVVFAGCKVFLCVPGWSRVIVSAAYIHPS